VVAGSTPLPEGVLSALDKEIAALFDKGDRFTLAELGGVTFLQGREPLLARAALMPELLALALAELPPGADAIGCFVRACAAVPVGGDGVGPATYKDAIDCLAGVALTASLAADVQDILSSRAADQAENEVARWAALGAALQIAVDHPDTRHDLLRVLVRLREDDHHSEFVRRAAKVAGVANSHWPDAALVRTLERLAGNTSARDEACFELGMHHLRLGMEGSTAQQVGSSFDEALASFAASASAREHRPDAEAYRGALSVLTGLTRGEEPGALRERAAEVAKAVAVKAMWGGQTEAVWPWLGAGWTELARWQALVGCLADVAEGMAASSDIDPAPAIKLALLEAYVANRAVLGREPGGVDIYIQPVIDSCLLQLDRARGAIEGWLSDETRNATEAPWREAAALMLRNLRRGSDPPGNC
jgi:hypothetical protein